jgi:hypothetical protein
MTDTPDKLVEVTQADREAAWSWRNKDAYSEADKAGWMDGIYDKCLNPIEAFARHRLQSLPDRNNVLEEAAKECEQVGLNAVAHHQNGNKTRLQMQTAIAARLCATAIRALKTALAEGSKP